VTRVVLSIGSNLGDRLGRLRAVVDGLGDRIVAVSPVFETPPWGPVQQDAFLNAVVVADDPDLDAHEWLTEAHRLENANSRERTVRWGPRTLDVDIVTCHDGQEEIRSADPVLTLPHPLAHARAFVLIPWLAVDPAARLSGRPVAELLEEIDHAERAGVRPTSLVLVDAGEN
jgi:2-amino-4-hydroxy-6-hydroxymethyldihydropteridine diphosphokinase